MELRQLWQIIWKRRSWVCTLFLLAMATATLVALAIKPVYQATAKVLLVQSNNADAADRLGLLPGVPALSTLSRTGTPLDTQVEVAKSATVLGPVIKAQHLHEKGQKAPMSVESFLQRGKLTSVQGTDVLAFSYRDADPKVAQRVADAWARSYIRNNSGLGKQDVASQVGFLQKQVKKSHSELRKAEAALRDYKQAHAPLSPVEEEKALAVTLSNMETELRQAEAARSESAARLSGLRQKVGMSDAQALAASALSEDGHLLRLRQQLQEGETELAMAAGKLTPDHPELEARRAQVQALRLRLDQETTAAARRQRQGLGLGELDPVRMTLSRDMLQTEIATSGYQSRLATLQRMSREFNSRLAALPEKARRTAMLERQVQLLAERDGQLERGLEAAKLKQALSLSNTRLIESAAVPMSSSNPVGPVWLLAGALAGLVLGVGGALLREHLDPSVKTLDAAMDATGLPLLGSVPRFPSATRSPLIALNEPRSQVGEACHSLRTQLILRLGGKRGQVIAVTSAIPGEGKSTLAANLAVSFAQLGQRVLLVDADMRGATQHLHFGLSNNRGLSTVLQQAHTLEKAVKQGPVLGLDVLTAGPLPFSPTELLHTSHMTALLDRLKAEYDMVLVDLPPVLAVADAAILAGRVDGVVWAVGAGRVTPDAARLALEQVQASQANILGMALCGLNTGCDAPYAYWTTQEAMKAAATSHHMLPPGRGA